MHHIFVDRSGPHNYTVRGGLLEICFESTGDGMAKSDSDQNSKKKCGEDNRQDASEVIIVLRQ